MSQLEEAPPEATSAMIALGDLVDRTKVRLTANGTFTVAHDNVMTGTVTLRDVFVYVNDIWFAQAVAQVSTGS